MSKEQDTHSVICFDQVDNTQKFVVLKIVALDNHTSAEIKKAININRTVQLLEATSSGGKISLVVVRGDFFKKIHDDNGLKVFFK